MELPRATLAQIREGKNGRKVEIGSDVLDVAKQVREISPDLHVYWNDDGEYFNITETCTDGMERLVTTTPVLDQRLLTHLRLLGSPGYDAGEAMERHERERDAELDHAHHERVGEVGERLAHALRKDLQAQNKIIVPRGI